MPDDREAARDPVILDLWGRLVEEPERIPETDEMRLVREQAALARAQAVAARRAHNDSVLQQYGLGRYSRGGKRRLIPNKRY